jgi:acyl carrier protein
MNEKKKKFIDQAIAWIRENHPQSVDLEIDGDTSLLETGALDSIGYVALLGHLEETMGCEFDLLDIDPEEFMTLNGLCNNAFGAE